jgi:hypothetical protein
MRAALGLAILCAGCGSSTLRGSVGTAGAGGATDNSGLAGAVGAAGAAGSGGNGGGAGAGSPSGGAGTAVQGGAGGAAGTGAGGAASTGAGGAAGGAGGATSSSPFFCNGTILGIADFDGDGIPDCVVTTPALQVLPSYVHPVFLQGLGYGAYSRTGIVSPIDLYSNPMGLSTVDMSGDGLPDLAVASDYMEIATPNNLVLSYLRSLGDGTFTESQLTFTPNLGVSWAFAGAGDFNGDGKPDVLVAAWSQDETEYVFWLLLSDKGSTELNTGVSLGYQGTLSPGDVPGDFNSDHNLDVAMAFHVVDQAGATTNQDVIIWYGAADGTFAAPVHVPGTTGATGVSVGDLNGDGNLDLDVSYGAPASTVVPMYGDGAGNFSTTPP